MTTSAHPGFLRSAAATATAISFGAPIFAALLLGWYGAGIPTTGIGSSLAITYWLAVLLPTWFAFETASWAIAYVLKPLNPPFISVVMLGCLIGGLAVRPFVVFIIGTFLNMFAGGGTPPEAPTFIWSVEWLFGFVQEALVILLLWIGANMLIHGPLALLRFGYFGNGQMGSSSSADHKNDG